MIQALILSVIQGITEWLPISSSGHLALTQNLFGIKGLSFVVYLHFASVFAIIFVFWKDIINIFDLRNKDNYRRLLLILLAIIPAGFVGLFFKDEVAVMFSSMTYLGVFFILSGLVVYSTKFAVERKTKIGPLDALFIGLFQIFGLFAGVSRSGMTISAGLFRGLKRESAVVFSFLMAIPVILGASVLEFKDIVNYDATITVLIASFIVSFLVSIVTIKLIVKIINNGKFYVFGIYNIILGIIILILRMF